MKRTVALKYLGRYESSKSSIDMLSLYDDYLNYITANAIGYNLPVADFGKIINEAFPKAVVSDGTVKGIKKREPFKRVEVVRDPFNELMINRIHSMQHYHPGTKAHFTLEVLAGYNDIDKQTVDSKKVEEWLQKSPFIYVNQHKGLYHFEQ